MNVEPLLTLLALDPRCTNSCSLTRYDVLSLDEVLGHVRQMPNSEMLSGRKENSNIFFSSVSRKKVLGNKTFFKVLK